MQRVYQLPPGTLLANNGVLTGAALSLASFSVAQPLPMAFGGGIPGAQPQLAATVYADQAGTLQLQQTDNPANTSLWQTIGTYAVAASTLLNVSGVGLSKLYWRFIYTNTGGSTQTAFELDINLFTGDPASPSLPASYGNVRGGNTFFVTNSAAQALSVNSTTATGIILYNPATSGVNLAIMEVIVQLASLPAGAFGVVLTGGVQSTTVTQTTTNVANGILNALVGAGSASKATVGSSATIATAKILRIIPLGAGATEASSTSFPPFAKDSVNGALVIPPGNVVSLQGITTASTVWGQITWQEIPIG
jgi:hypothetical protein